jgi:hypothetical protein
MSAPTPPRLKDQVWDANVDGVGFELITDRGTDLRVIAEMLFCYYGKHAEANGFTWQDIKRVIVKPGRTVSFQLK